MLLSCGATEPLQTLATFSAKVVSTRSCAECQVHFVVVKGDGRTLLGRETAETLGLLRVGPLKVKSVVCEHSGDRILVEDIEICLPVSVYSKVMS